MTTHEDEWLTIRQAALALNISELTVRRRIKDGRLAHRLTDGKYFVNLSLPAPAPSAGEGDGPETFPEEQREPPATATLPPPDPTAAIAAFLPEYGRLAERAGQVAALEERLRRLEEQHASLQQNALALANRNGWLESKLEERESEVKLLTDSQRRGPWWKRLFSAEQ